MIRKRLKKRGGEATYKGSIHRSNPKQGMMRYIYLHGIYTIAMELAYFSKCGNSIIISHYIIWIPCIRVSYYNIQPGKSLCRKAKYKSTLQPMKEQSKETSNHAHGKQTTSNKRFECRPTKFCTNTYSINSCLKCNICYLSFMKHEAHDNLEAKQQS